MAGYRLLIDRRAWKKDFKNIPRGDLSRIMRRIGKLAAVPRPPDKQKLRGRTGYRLRQGAYRILYEVDDDKRSVTVRSVAHRREAYRR